jgi:hypothetical protein
MDEAHLMTAVRYVEFNPVKAKLVKRAEDWPWSSARAHVGGKPDGLTDLAGLAGVHRNWRAMLRRGLEAGDLAPEAEAAIEAHRRTGRPWGDAAFVEWLEAGTGRIKWLAEWYLAQCNGDWEHQYGITIESLDNPGWSIVIDLEGTDLRDREWRPTYYNVSESDLPGGVDGNVSWHCSQVSENKFVGYGGPLNLPDILNNFRKLARPLTSGT